VERNGMRRKRIQNSKKNRDGKFSIKGEERTWDIYRGKKIERKESREREM
jgi:hypothetical protein